MRKNIVLMACCVIMGAMANSQLVNDGAVIYVSNGAYIKSTGDITNKNGGSINNAGLVSTDGALRNEAGATLANNVTAGLYEATTRFVNYGNSFSALKLKLIGNVNSDSVKSGFGSTYDSVFLAKGSGFNATLSDVMLVNGGFAFSNDNNKLILEDENLVLGPAAGFQSPDNNQFVITNNTGTLTKQNLGAVAFQYPVGFSATEYNPLTVTNSGTVDDINVRCLQNVLANGFSGSTVTSDFAGNSWVIGEGLAGGSNLALTGEWIAGDELPFFNRVKSGIARYNTGTDWDLPPSQLFAAAGAGPYTNSRSGVTSTGVFAVADQDQVNAARLNLKIFLQGPYVTAAGLMKDSLRSKNVLPTTQPYSAALNSFFTRLGVFDGSATVNETVPSSSVFDVAGTNDDIVDWVYLSMNDGTTPATKLQTRAALLQRDGDIVEYNPSTGTYGPVRMPLETDANYHLVVGHRNHLAVRTPVSQLLQDNTTFNYNFTTAQAQAYQNPAVTANAAMKDLGAGVFGMLGGNANSNNTVRATGVLSLNDYLYLVTTVLGSNVSAIIIPAYNAGDMNMDGQVRATGVLNINDYLFLITTALGSDVSKILTQHQ